MILWCPWRVILDSVVVAWRKAGLNRKYVQQFPLVSLTDCSYGNSIVMLCKKAYKALLKDGNIGYWKDISSPQKFPTIHKRPEMEISPISNWRSAVETGSVFLLHRFDFLVWIWFWNLQWVDMRVGGQSNESHKLHVIRAQMAHLFCYGSDATNCSQPKMQMQLYCNSGSPSDTFNRIQSWSIPAALRRGSAIHHSCSLLNDGLFVKPSHINVSNYS